MRDWSFITFMLRSGRLKKTKYPLYCVSWSPSLQQLPLLAFELATFTFRLFLLGLNFTGRLLRRTMLEPSKSKAAREVQIIPKWLNEKYALHLVAKQWRMRHHANDDNASESNCFVWNPPAKISHIFIWSGLAFANQTLVCVCIPGWKGCD